MFCTDFNKDPNSPACWMKWIVGSALLMLQLSILSATLGLHIALESTFISLPLRLFNLEINIVYRLLFGFISELDIYIVLCYILILLS